MMKKTPLKVVAIGLFVAILQSCVNSKKAESSTDSIIVSGNTTVKKITTKTEKSIVPTFSSVEVNKGLADYAKLKEAYITALKNNDQAQVEALTTKYTDWAQGAMMWDSKLKANEVQKYSEYMTKLSQEWAAAAQEAVK